MVRLELAQGVLVNSEMSTGSLRRPVEPSDSLPRGSPAAVIGV